MSILPNPWKSRLHICRRMGWLLSGVVLSFIAGQVAQSTASAASAAPVAIRGYLIDVTLDPTLHSLTAKTQVTFTVLEKLTTVAFQLNPALRVTSITGETGTLLAFSQANGTIVITPASSLAQGKAESWTFTYSGVFDEKPGNTVRLASVGDPVSALLYRADWFPVIGNGVDRFTAEVHVHVPVGEQVLGSGAINGPAGGKPHPDANGRMEFDFNWPRPGFPGMIVAGKFQGPFAAADSPVRVFLIDQKVNSQQLSGSEIAATAAKQFRVFAAEFGPTETDALNIVELPDDMLPAIWAPEIAAIAGNQLKKTDFSRLLANTIARQWWGNQVSPATLDDAWITNGMCRYAELEALRRTVQPAVFADAIFNVSASALAYDSVPLANMARLPEFSPQFQAMTYDKGAMVFRMLRWQIGDAAFQQALSKILSRKDKSISSAEVEQIAEAASHQNLRPFFTQWLHDTGAPMLDDKWTLYRLGNNQGFRTVGEIDEDLDLFQMPVEVRVETEGKTVHKRIEVMGPQTQFTIDTFGIPTHVSLDPERWLLRNGSALQVRVHILRGLRQEAENNSAGAIQEYRAALALDATSSLASYRLGEVFFRQCNYQAAEDAFRAVLSGDGVPKWAEVWSDLQLGKIFDASGQRDRAVNEYREALETQDNTSGALALAGEYLTHPFAPPANTTH